jgi:hypothetical protein
VASISDAFCATGAKRGFLYPCKLRLEDGLTMRFGDETFTNCLTNATPIVLDEVTRIYGNEARISVIVNIGSGVPHEEDLRKIHSLSRRLSWESTSSKSSNGSNGSRSSKSSKSLCDSSEPLPQRPFWRKLKCICLGPEDDGESQFCNPYSKAISLYNNTTQSHH